MQISIIGTSKITYDHIQVLQKKFKIVSISSTRTNSKNLKKIANKFKINTTFTNWQKSIEYYKNKKNLIFFITGRIKDNKKILRECCKYKNKIFIEKPVFINSKDFDEFLGNNNKIFVGYNRIFYKNIIFLKNKIKNKKNLNVIVKCPELSKKQIFTNSCHVISILLFLFGKLYIKRISNSKNYINCTLNDKYKNEIYITFNLRSSDNFSIEIFQDKIRYLLSPIENLKIFEKIEIKKKKNNFIYKPKQIFILNEYNVNNYKPGFENQMKNFFKFCKGKNIINNLLFSKKIIKLCEQIIK